MQEARWAPEPVVENLILTGIRSSDRPTDRPTSSESLHQLRYPGPWKFRRWEEYRTEWNYAFIDHSSAATFKYFSARYTHENLLCDLEFRDYWRSESQTFLREIINFVSIFFYIFSDLCEILYMISTDHTVWHFGVSLKSVLGMPNFSFGRKWRFASTLKTYYIFKFKECLRQSV